MSAGSVEERLAALEAGFEKRKTNVDAGWAKIRADEEAGVGVEEGCCWQSIKVLQYIFGIAISSYAVFITCYGLANSMSGTSDFLHPALSFLFLAGLITILAFCEGTQIALMLLEKIPARDMPDNICCANRVKFTHAIAKANTERYLVGRQIFVTGIVFLIAKLIYMKPEFADFVAGNLKGREDEGLGFLGNEVLINIFVYTGLSGSLVVLAFGQLVPQLIVTMVPTLQYQLFPTYEIIVIQLFCDRIGLGYMANICRDATRWAFNLEVEPFGVGSEVVISSGELDQDKEELSGFVKFWTSIPTWNNIIQYIVGVVVFVGGVALTILNVINGNSDFTRIKWHESPYSGYCKNVQGATVKFTACTDITKNSDTGLPTAAVPDVCGEQSCLNEGGKWVPDKIKPWQGDANGDGLTKGGAWVSESGDISIWIQLLLFIPLSNIAMGFLEGTQIAILALEKAPAATIKRVHRDAYFGAKLTTQRDNVRRYLLGRQFLVVFVDFIAAHTMGLGGLGILVPVAQLYPQLTAATNPMWFMGSWGSKTVLLLCLLMEFCGFCHFSWALFTIFYTVRHMVKGDDNGDEVGSVGAAVDISGGLGETQGPPQSLDELRTIVIDQQNKIRRLEGKIKPQV